MAGVEWLTQLVNFPMLNLVSQDSFPAYQANIIKRIVLPIVIPGSITIILSLLLLEFSAKTVPHWAIFTVALLQMIPVISTATIQLPRQRKLSQEGFSSSVIKSLMMSQWLRTIPVTLAALLLLWMLIICDSQ